MATKKKIVGRPTKWKPSYVQEVAELMAQGYKDVQIMSKWGVSADTFYRWIREKKDLKEAYDNALPICQDFWEQIGFQGMMGQIRGFRENMWKSFMKNKFKEWKDDNPVSHQINIDKMNVLHNYSEMDKDKLLEVIRKKIKVNHLEDEESRESK